MSGYAQEWVWTHSKVLGIPKYIFLAIARRVFKNKAETGPTPMADIVKITGMSESTVRRSIDVIVEAGDLKVVKADRRGTVHRYELGMQGRLPVDATGPTEPTPRHRSQRTLSPVTENTESPPLSPVTENTVTGQPDGCQPSAGLVSPVSVTGAYVQDSSQVRTNNKNNNKNQSNTAAAPLGADKSREPNGDNYRVIEALAIEVLNDSGDQLPTEADLVEQVKCACALRSIDYGALSGSFDVVHRACASAWFKHRHPDIARKVGS